MYLRRLPWRVLVLGVLVALIFLAGNALIRGTQRASGLTGPRQAATAGLDAVPEPAQSAISRLLGRKSVSYRVRALSTRLGMRNTAQGLGATFGRRGVTIDAGKTQLGLQLQGYGRGNSLHPVRSTAPEAHANRVSYRHGPLTEWYANGPLGLEQGFRLSSRPAADPVGPVSIALSVSGTTPRLAADAKGLRFVGSALRYDGLAASDARGRSLRAWLELHGRRLLIRVDDVGARYPLTIDPIVQLAKLTASDAQADSQFGWSVAMSDDTIVVGQQGAPTYRGALYVFTKPASGWANATETAKLTGSDPNDYETGFSVAISGDTIVSGMPVALSPRGLVNVYVKPAGGWRDSTEIGRAHV